ncbi:MAG: AMP-dependent synthetase/ligase, partial [Acidobacteriota bacterium]
IMVYTSGTTGPPKAAMISHENVLTLMEHISEFFPYRDNDLLFAFLPMAHVTERVLAFYGRIAVGVPAAYASSIGAVLDELPEVRPTVFGSVPRLFEKLYDRVQGQVEKAPAAKRKLFRWGESVARRRFDLLQADRPVPALLGLQYRIASKLVFAKIHDAFGGRVRACITGAAPISMEILTFLWSIDLPIFEAYGMTEATVLTHANHFGAVKLGTVGRSVPTIEMRIAEDGEILLRGPLVFLGYFKNPEATAETLSDGWLHSGDIGEVDEDGFLRITDRKKHLIITAGGKNVAPANIERAIKNQSPLISNVHAHGDRRRYISALITPSPLDTLDWGLEHGVLQADVVEALRQELQADPSARSEGLEHAMRQVVARRDFQDLFVEPVQRGNTALAKVEKVKRFVVLDRDFSQEGGEMTPTMKMRRGAIEKKYVELFDKIYTDDSFSLVAEDRAS